MINIIIMKLVSLFVMTRLQVFYNQNKLTKCHASVEIVLMSQGVSFLYSGSDFRFYILGSISNKYYTRQQAAKAA